MEGKNFQMKYKLFYLVRLRLNKLIYGQPALCGKHSSEHPARSAKLDSFNCVMCSPEEKEKSKMQQDWFNLLSFEQISLAESDYELLLKELNNPKDPNTELAQSFKKYKDKYGA